MKNLDLRINRTNSKGITLVALVISIIVLLILATVSINLIINNGILDKAKLAVDKYSEGEELEQIQLAVLSAQMKNKLTTESLNIELQKILNNDKEVTEYSDYFFYKTNKSYRIYKDGKVEEGNLLPDKYQQLKYIEGSGSQYIDTGVSNGVKASYEIWLNCLGNRTSNYEQYFAGDKNSAIPKLFNDNSVVSQDQNTRITLFSNTNTMYKVKYGDNGKIYVNDVEKGQYSQVGNGWGDLTWYIFSSHEENNLKSTMQLYFLKMYNDGTIVRNFIPCYSTTIVTNSDGVQVPANTKGLYDLVEGKFYTNKGTEDDFIAGPEV